MRTLLFGLIAGTAGKAALDITTYLDMLVRGRPASRVPARVAERIHDAAAEAGSVVTEAIPGDAGASPDQRAERMSAAAGNDPDEGPGPRASAAGALSGYAIGLGLGAAYGLVRPRLGSLPVGTALVGGTALAVAAMAAGDLPAVGTGATSHPREWGTMAWLSDIVPHAIDGIVTAATFELLLPEPSAMDELRAAIAR